MTIARVEQISGGPLGNWSDEAAAAANIARALAPTPFVPDSLRVFTDRDHQHIDLQATTATVAAALLTGHELGLTPMASLRSIDVIRGTPALRALALRALLQRGGHRIWLVESTKTRCVMRGHRASEPDHVQESVWTMDRARDLRMIGFDDPRGSWKRQPQNMLIARATAEIARLIAADAILGLPYIVEELDDTDQDGAGPAISPPEPDRPAPRTARRRTQPHAPQPAGGATLAATQASPFGDEPPLEDEPTKPAQDPPMITAAQLKALHAALRDLDITDRDKGLATISGWIGRDIASTKEMYRAEGIAAINAANVEKTRRAEADQQAREHEEQIQQELKDWQQQEGGDGWI